MHGMRWDKTSWAGMGRNTIVFPVLFSVLIILAKKTNWLHLLFDIDQREMKTMTWLKACCLPHKLGETWLILEYNKQTFIREHWWYSVGTIQCIALRQLKAIRIEFLRYCLMSKSPMYISMNIPGWNSTDAYVKLYLRLEVSLNTRSVLMCRTYYALCL